ncbi:hypothetical protein AGMMS50268_40760 [Spirochaetia bacterium]|nr:hypothetical protein AGMMS50268_40760 [Spirochaetia bacterium]
MAIQPIDLQTLFTQMDKVGKAQSAQKEGLAIQQSIQSLQMQKRTDEHIRSVNEAQDTGQGTEQINDRNAHKRQNEEGAASDEGEEEPGAEAETPVAGGKTRVFRDPALGKNVDFSG